MTKKNLYIFSKIHIKQKYLHGMVGWTDDAELMDTKGQMY